ncbi:hypothetical protein SAMN04244574_02011 [Azotobacter beijerinckii]|uniref:Uncharacterized protein n=1 Tax=Azotobacter beijerinckii TaxID=170623 RepID=A0A1I4CN87_9GAMM|nr:hypothetical protein SAMN04244571_01920 [Azotobacter beijerinckii]SFK82734.1 hypothetical protein SAMN04244574_02011 [Azotobacter beijerinckii]
MEPVGKNECEAIPRKGTYHAAYMLNRIAPQVDLYLKILMAVRASLGAMGSLVSNMEIRSIAALLHAVGGHSS